MPMVAGPASVHPGIVPGGELTLMRQNSAARQGVRNAGERLAGRQVVGHSQPCSAAGADEQGGPMKQLEAERLHALQQGHDGVFSGAAPLGGTCGWRIANQPRNPLRLSSLVILGVVARMSRCATGSSYWFT